MAAERSTEQGGRGACRFLSSLDEMAKSLQYHRQNIFPPERSPVPSLSPRITRQEVRTTELLGGQVDQRELEGQRRATGQFA